MEHDSSLYLLHMQVEEDDDDIENDPDYQPSDTTMMTDSESVITPSEMTGTRSGIVSSVSEISPDDSISVREAPAPRGWNPRDRVSDDSESVSLKTFHSSGERSIRIYDVCVGVCASIRSILPHWVFDRC